MRRESEGRPLRCGDGRCHDFQRIEIDGILVPVVGRCKAQIGEDENAKWVPANQYCELEEVK